ncbi:MAG: toll/interleukin-1 receptor domain-containing protein [Thermodesulfobacteriota bacterium]
MMPVANGRRLIFISHSGEDTWVARQIAGKITECGATYFLDEADVDVGAEFEEDIRDFLDKADELIVLFTPWALERPYVWVEIGAAWIRRIPIVILLHGLTIKDFQTHPNAPVFLKKRDMIKLNDIDQYLDQLSTRVLPGRKDD